MDTKEISLDGLRSRLLELRQSLDDDPLANPVRRLGYELSREIEAGRLSLTATRALVDDLTRESVAARKAHVATYTAHVKSLRASIQRLVGEETNAGAFEKQLARPLETIVFTGHPTFSMRPQGKEALVNDASVDEAILPRHGVVLADEHDEACQALGSAADAVCAVSTQALEEAHKRFGDEFRTMELAPVGLATWVGYDLDGRQDIGWVQIFLHRLAEKAYSLADYLDRLGGVPGTEPILRQLTESLAATKSALELFRKATDAGDPQTVAEAANQLTAEGPGRLTSLRGVRGQLLALAKTAEPTEAIKLLSVASLMKVRGLGLGEVHFRLNAAQVRNAARDLVPIERDADLFGNVALNIANQAIHSVEPVRINFGSLAAETSSARRIVMAACQIRKHIDEDVPIRLLIAECENPVTVLTAIYLAKRYGVDDGLDICPLFETALSLERSGRIISKLLAQPAYQAQVRLRGRVAVEAGFSDAGRFMGQIPATLAIERLHGQLADSMAQNALTDLEAVIFNTHGESMGRGGHPQSIQDRSRYVMSPWSRARFASLGIRLSHEISFQGGDGFVWFASPQIAKRIIAGLLEVCRSDAAALDDPFYKKSDLSMDFFNTVKAEQIRLFHQEAMITVALGPGLALLPPAGSRKTKRQFERSGEEEPSLRKIRAIAHNGSLQQIGYLANLHAGVGEAFALEPETYKELRSTSDRFDRLMRLLANAAHYSDMKTLIAYLKLYDGSFWATRPIAPCEEAIEKPCADLASHLVGSRRYFAALELAARLRPGAIVLKRTLYEMGFADLGPAPINLDLLHALRLALIQHIFLLGAKLPSFASVAGFSRDEVLDEILALEIPKAVEQLREGFPRRELESEEALFDEAADDEPAGVGYGRLELDIIAPLEESFSQCQQIGLAISHHFGAHG